MLTRLRFKNWRSLRDVTIDNLTPLTVFIGANSSGKTNIVDALSFLRRMVQQNNPQAVYFQGERDRVRTIGADKNDPLELEFSFKPVNAERPLTYTLIMQPGNKLIRFFERLIDGDGQVVLQASDGQGYTMSEVVGGVKEDVQLTNALVFASFQRAVVSPQGEEAYIERRGQMYSFVSKRWQILRKNFMPPTSVPIDEYHDPYSIERSGRNVPTMLDFMQKTNRAVYDELQSDMRWLLNHVDNLEVETDERETRYDIVEKVLQGQKGPTTSTGTARILAMLTAYYALDLRYPNQPGLLVIEEPDMAVHPALLKRLVELFREYVNREGYPRQIMVTTHNPQFLNWFETEEVRVVERDEHGDTSVHEIPTYIKGIWLDSGEYGLGDVWMTRSLGGVPE